MSNRDIRAKATAIRESTDGMMTLFLAPVLIMVLSDVLDRMWGQAGIVLWGNTFVKNGVTRTIHYISLGPSSLFDFLVQCLLVTACFQLIRVVRNETSIVSFKDCCSLLDGKNFLPIVVTILLKQIFLYVAAFPTTVGVALILLSFYNSIVIVEAPVGYSPDFSSLFNSTNLYLGLILMLVGIVLNLYINYGLSQVSFLLYDYLDKDLYTSPFKIFKQSWQLMSGNKWRRFLLDLSFIGWFIGVILTLGLLGLYVFPYYWTCQALFYEDLIAKNPLVFSDEKTLVTSTPA
ncbi:DUF975 family protein [Streptococcus suis]|nr:DUF975 family protein [Streptococcus suis]